MFYIYIYALTGLVDPTTKGFIYLYLRIILKCTFACDEACLIVLKSPVWLTGH